MFKFIVITLAITSTFADFFRDRIRKKLESADAPISIDFQKIEEFKSGGYTLKMTINNLDRYFKVHIPKSFSKDKKNTVIFALHGGGGNMEIQSNDEYYNLISFSEKNNTVMVFPNGFSEFKSGKFATWNAGTCCAKARDQKIDDVKFIKNIYSFLETKLKMDKKKVFAIGMSNGAMMSYKLACEMPDVFAGIAAVAGTDNTVNCEHASPISLIHFHAKNDDHVLFEGGLGPKAINKEAESNFNSVDYSIKKWLKINKCTNDKKRIVNLKDAFCDLYSKCSNKTKIQLCVTQNGGHSWPGGKKILGTTPTSTISANEILWEFFNE